MYLIPTPYEILEELNRSPLVNVCWRRLLLTDHHCKGRLTWEHALYHGARRVNETWSIIRLCAYAHSVDEFQDAGIMNKKINQWLALSRITDWNAVEKKYPRTAWRRDFRYYCKLYGDARWPSEPS